MKTLAVLLLLTSIQTAMAAGSAKMITYKSGNDTVNAYYSTPPGTGPFPAVILIHEWWGLNDQIKGVTDRLAKEGYVVLAVDLYRGKVTKDPDEAHQIMMGVPEDRVIGDLKAAFQYLATQEQVHKDRIGSIGWCWGGGFSLQLAINEPRLAACVMFYGRPVNDAETLKKIHAPVFGLYGAEDKGIPPESAQNFEKQMKAAGKSIELHIYPGAGHGFFNETGKAYNPAAAKDAWAKTLAFLSANLKR